MYPPPPPFIVGVSQKPDDVRASGLAIEAVRVAWNLKQAATEARDGRMVGTGPSVADVCGAWLAGRITATEGMEAISLHRDIVGKVLGSL